MISSSHARRMQSETVPVQLGARSYDIVATSDDAAGLGAFARQRSVGKRALVVTDDHLLEHANRTVAALAAHGFATTTAVVEPGEASKCLECASTLYDELVAVHADRKTLIVAVGGGVIGDLAGFVAATYNRGLPLLMGPTTLLAMVDSSFGGTEGITQPTARSRTGAVHHPAAVRTAPAV